MIYVKLQIYMRIHLMKLGLDSKMNRLVKLLITLKSNEFHCLKITMKVQMMKKIMIQRLVLKHVMN